MTQTSNRGKGTYEEQASNEIATKNILRMKKGLFSSQFFLAGWERVNPSSQFDSRIVKYTLFCFFGLKCYKMIWQARKTPYFLLILGPSNASWSSWSNWSSCSGNCKTRGEAVPKKFRSRTCIPEKFGGKNCSFLEDQARMNQQPLHKEEHECFELCPGKSNITANHANFQC